MPAISYFTDDSNQRIREITTSGLVFTVAGNGNCGTTTAGVKASLSVACAAIALDPAGNLFIADRPSAASTISPAADNNRIRMVNTSGIISTIAGPQPGYNGEAISSTAAALGGPVALATDAQGNLYVNESSTQRIRKFTKVSGPIPAKRRSVL